jgi:hypothetical protein
VRLATAFLIYFQVLVLALTSPISAGRGPHRDQLLDPVFPHVHPDAPPPVAVVAAVVVRSHAGVPTVGAGAGLEPALYGEMLVPPMSVHAFVRLPLRRLIPSSDRPPRFRQEPPPDPPPLTQA